MKLLSYREDDDDNDVGFKNDTCFMALGENVSSFIHPLSDKVVDENMFETIEEAYDWVVESWKAMTAKLVKLQTQNAKIEEERIQLMQQLDMANSRIAELLEKHDELKRIIDNFDKTTVEKMDAEINDANDAISCL